MKALKTINYYQQVGCIDFGMGIYNSAKFLDEDQIPIQEEIARWLTSLRISNLWEAVNQDFHQSWGDDYKGDNNFPIFNIIEPFAD